MERVWPKLGDVLLVLLAVVVGAAAVAVSLGYGLRDAPDSADALAPQPSASASPAVIGRPVRALFIGGSVISGASRTPGSPTLAEVAAVQLGWEGEYDGRTGSGFTTAGKPPIPDLTELTASNTDDPQPDVVVVQGGEADADATAEEIGAGVTEVIGAIRAAFDPSTRIVVIGPFSPVATAPAPLVAVSEAVRTAAKAAKVHHFDPIAEGWISASQPAGLVNGGSRLPTSDGHLALGRILAADLDKLAVRPLQ